MPMIIGVPVLPAGLLLLAAVCALWFGLRENSLQPSWLRASVKAGAVSALAAGLAAAGATGFLLVALISSAIGDFLLVFKRQRTFALGMLAFLIAHIGYIVLFSGLRLHSHGGLEPLWPRLAVVAALFLCAVLYLAWLWRDLGLHRLTVPLYAMALLGMATSALLLPWAAFPAMVGALLFVFSDAVLAAQTFRADIRELPPILRGHSLVWWTYVAAQTLIVIGVVLAGHGQLP